MEKKNKIAKKVVTTFAGSMMLSSVLLTNVVGAAADSAMIPLRSALQSEGASITWDQATKTVGFTLKNGLKGTVVVGAKIFELGGEKADLSSEVVLQNGKTIVPNQLVDLLKTKKLTEFVLHEKGYESQVIIEEHSQLNDGNDAGDSFDLNAYVPINGAEEGWLYTSNETRPGGGFLQRVISNTNGFYSVLESKRVNFDAVGGTWNNCAGNITPWGTILSGEERVGDLNDDNFAKAQEAAAKQGIVFSSDPTNFGLIVEIDPNTMEVKKHRSLGQFKHEAAIVMNDNKTVYLTDDTGGGILTKFVADQEKDLSSGTLYAAQLNQTTGKVTWIQLSEDDLIGTSKKAVAKGATPFDRPEDIEYNPVDGMIYWAATDSTILHPENNDSGNYGVIYQLNPQTDEMKVWLEGSAETFANPDGVAIHPITGEIYVQEDNYEPNMLPTIDQDNSAIWRVTLDKKVTKFASVPFAAEVTGAFFSPDGKVMFVNAQHPAAPVKDQLIQIKGF